MGEEMMPALSLILGLLFSAAANAAAVVVESTEEACQKQAEAFRLGFIKPGKNDLISKHGEPATCENRTGKRTRYLRGKRGKPLEEGYLTTNGRTGRWKTASGPIAYFEGRKLSPPSSGCDPVFRNMALLVVHCPNNSDLKLVREDVMSWIKEIRPATIVDVYEAGVQAPESAVAANRISENSRLNFATFEFNLAGDKLVTFVCIKGGAKKVDCLN